jgi:hypothetical protein
VFRFLSGTISFIGLLSLLLLFGAPAEQRSTILLFAILTLLIGASFHLIKGDTVSSTSIQQTADTVVHQD